ncbi:MAG: GAK system XXXCH domain-containing protein [Thermodesulfobacteriota bacterium]
MGEKEHILSRLELADYLKNLGEQLRRGSLEAHGRSWTVPDNLDVRLELKEKKGHLAAKLSWSWSTLGDYDGMAREEVSRWQDSMKTVKKRLGASFKALQQTVAQGAFPDNRTLDEYVAASQAFAAMAEPDWQGAMQEYMDHLANLQHAVANRQQEVIIHELRDLQACMSSCHREFKSRGGAAE